MAEVWYRNPSNYVRELRECNEPNIIFDYGWIIKKKIDPQKWASLYFGEALRYRILICGDQGTAEYQAGTDDPIAVYPTWQYGEDESDLETFMARNVGDDSTLCNLPGVPVEENYVFGQEHRVLVMNFPALHTGPGKMFLKLVKELQEEYPDAILHLHGATLFSTPCRLGLRAFDYDPRTPAAHGTVFLPTGFEIRQNESTQKHTDWITMLGFKPIELKEPRNRCMFNIKAARWAADNFHKDARFVLKRKTMNVDSTTPDAEYDPVVNNRIMFKNDIKPKPGDKWLCNQCSLAMACKFYREGAVCTVPNSEPKQLADFFKTRDSNSIMDGLASIMQVEAQRYADSVEMEEIGGLDKHTTQIGQALFDKGVKLAKLVDPSLRNPKVQVTVGSGGSVGIGVGDPRQFIAEAVRQLELEGFARKDITPEMIKNVLEGSGVQPRTIEGTVVEVGTVAAPADVVDVSELPF